MGHLAAKDVYRDLGRAIDGSTVRAPWNETFHAILRELYTEEEAALVSRMPSGLATLDRIRRVTKTPAARLRPLLDRLADKGLVMDLRVGSEWRFTVSPLVVGIFEFTMMRSDGECDLHRMAALFHEYMAASDPISANFGNGKMVSVMRTLPHEDALARSVTVLDYQSAQAILDNAPGVAVGACSCRHEKMHLGTPCTVAPLQSCISLAEEADYIVRRKLARPVSRTEARELLAMAREKHLVLNADNVRTGVSFLCLCCGCCCNLLGSMRSFGLADVVITSGFVAVPEPGQCTGCGKCASSCPIQAIRMKERKPEVDGAFCIGCGVCALSCPSKAMRLQAGKKRVLLPESTIERAALQALERGTLQNFIVDNPNLQSTRFLRSLVGAFLKLPPVKRAIMSRTFRSVFLSRIASP